MILSEIQRNFLEHVLVEDASFPPGWDSARMRAGLSVYRDGYRSRLIDALADTYPRTRQWVGRESFDQAAAHHLILHPPAHWSLDMAGMGFGEILAILFAHDPEVPELAALEWDMHLAFVAGDARVLDAQAFAMATAQFSDEDWQGLRLIMHPALTLRPIHSTAVAIWHALSEDRPPPVHMLLEKPAHLMVWREGNKPVFRTLGLLEACAIHNMMKGDTFDQACRALAADNDPQQAAADAGTMLGRWLAEGLVTGIETATGA